MVVHDRWLDRVVRRNRPALWTIGAGPKLVDLTTSYADGITAVAPYAFPTPEQYAEFVVEVRRELARKHRDPDQFGFGLEFGVPITTEYAVLEEIFKHPLIKLFSAVYGRFGAFVRSCRRGGNMR
jgi:phthiodiolone/phenolphthiodiolone dimycocerosates ketoreductase